MVDPLRWGGMDIFWNHQISLRLSRKSQETGKPRSQSSLAISDETSPVKLVGKRELAWVRGWTPGRVQGETGEKHLNTCSKRMFHFFPLLSPLCVHSSYGRPINYTCCFSKYSPAFKIKSSDYSQEDQHEKPVSVYCYLACDHAHPNPIITAVISQPKNTRVFKGSRLMDISYLLPHY